MSAVENDKKTKLFPIKNYCLLDKGFVFDAKNRQEREVRDITNIFRLCKEQNCVYFGKSVDVFDNPKVYEEAEREVYFILALQDVTLNGQKIVPFLYDYWLCKKMKMNILTEDRFISIYEAWEGDGKDLVFKMGPTPEIVTRLFKLAIALGLLGIVHGDLKLDQFIYRHKNGKLEIAVTDFGFSGGNVIPDTPAKMGWTYKKYGCFEGYEEILYPPELNVSFPIAFNLFQLEAQLVLYNPNKFDEILREKGLPPFLGLSNFDSGRAAVSSRLCSQYKTDYDTLRQKQIEQKLKGYTLDHDILVSSTFYELHGKFDDTMTVRTDDYFIETTDK
jgi:hypothetical protein